MRLWPVLLPSLLWGFAAHADIPQPVSYSCERGAVISVVYVNETDPQLAILWAEGQHIVLPSVPSGSGARYAQEGGYVWHSKGGEAFLAWAEDDRQTILTQCRENPAG